MGQLKQIKTFLSELTASVMSMDDILAKIAGHERGELPVDVDKINLEMWKILKLRGVRCTKVVRGGSTPLSAKVSRHYNCFLLLKMPVRLRNKNMWGSPYKGAENSLQGNLVQKEVLEKLIAGRDSPLTTSACCRDGLAALSPPNASSPFSCQPDSRGRFAPVLVAGQRKKATAYAPAASLAGGLAKCHINFPPLVQLVECIIFHGTIQRKPQCEPHLSLMLLRFIRLSLEL